MRAWIVDAPAPIEENPLRRTEVPDPEPGPGEILICVGCCGVCRTDLHVVEGDLDTRKRPVIPGHQVVGTVDTLGAGVHEPTPGTRVGVAWLYSSCGQCAFCTTGRENLCDAAEFTGWSRDGGYADALVAPASFVHPLPEGVPDLQAAPLLCAGIIGFRALRLVEPDPFPAGLAGMRLGIYGFGAAGHVVIQVARAHGAEVHVMTRDAERHQKLAAELGAAWVGGAHDRPPVDLDAALVFAPAGELVPEGLRALARGGRLVLGGIHMSDIPSFPYSILWGERMIRSVANNTRRDAREFLAEAARIPVRTHVEMFRMDEAPRALAALENDAVRGAAVLVNAGG